MKNPVRLTIRPAALLALIFLWGGLASGYEEPDFDYAAFSSDGIFLEQNVQQRVLQALASLAANFPGNERVDEDLREKALAVALRLDPLHYGSRRVHEALLAGATPKPTNYFDSLSAVSETIWRSAARLVVDPMDPEEARLAPYLMEIALLLHPDPPRDRLARFGEALESQPPSWSRFVALDAEESSSTSRAESLREEAVAAAAAAAAAAPAAEPGPEMTSADTPEPDAPDSPPSPDDDTSPGVPENDFEPVTRSLALVRSREFEGETTVVAGVLTLTLRQPPAGARGVPEGNDSRLPLFGAGGGRLRNLDVSADALPGMSWPKGVIGAFEFESEGSGGNGPPRPGRLAALLLLRSALTDTRIDDRFALAGSLSPPDEPPRLEGDPIAVIEAARTLDRSYLLAPASALDPLVESVSTSGRIDLLFGVELIAYESAAEALSITSEPIDPALSEASETFAEIRGALERGVLPPDDFARNAKVQERLELVLETYPGHLSAGAALQFGRLPLSDSARRDELIARIDSIMEPFYALRDQAFEEFQLKQRIDGADLELSRMRGDLPRELRDYRDLAEDTVAAAEKYLNLTNRDTSIALQRLDQARELLDKLEAERAALESTSPGAE